MNCSSSQKGDTSEPFYSISLGWPCYPPNNAPIWSAASVRSLNVLLTPFSNKGRRYSRVLFPIHMGCMVCITPFAASFPTSIGYKFAYYRRVLWHLISWVGLFHKHFYSTRCFSSVILCTTSLRLLHSKRQQLTRSYWKFRKPVLKHHLLLQVTVKAFF